MSIIHFTPENAQICIVLSSARQIKENNMAVIKEITEKGYQAIVVTINQPAHYLREYYGKNGIDLSRVSFIDTITKYAGGRIPEDMPASVFLSNPGDLTGLSIAVTESLKNRNDLPACILIDSINAMLIYLPSGDLSRFIHFVSSKLKILDLSGIFLAVESGLDPILLAQLTSFSDDIIDLNGA
ncbi:MAG: hypothetical protein PWP08_519 [Methanofollis sp.]|nr:hypothetical protein [Methanofollis sp.]